MSGVEADNEIEMTYTEMIVDNIKVHLSNIHIRIENKEEKTASSIGNFSLGMTLDSCDVITVDESGDPVKFIDRRQKELQSTSLHKKLELHNLGMYFHTAEETFLIDCPIDQREKYIEENYCL